MESSNLKIFLSIVLSLVIFFGANYILKNPEQTKNTIYQAPNIILSSIKTLNPLPFFSQITKKFFNPPTPQFAHLSNWQNTNWQNKNNNINNNSFNLPTSSFQFTPPSPTPTQKIIFKIPTPTIFYKPITKTKKITKPPVPTPSPQIIITEKRPGQSLQEIAQIAQRYTCTPAALLLAIKSIESGESFLKADKKTIEKYNTYGWWKNASSIKEICDGHGYDEIKGIIPQDSAFAGERCQVPLGNQNYPYKIMGILALDDHEEQSYIDDFQKVFKTNISIDRRVLFDSFILGGFHFKNISLERSNNCQNWELKYIAKVACKYQGGCHFQYQTGSNRSGDYCFLVCEKYNQYAGTHYNCSNASNYVDAYCNFK